MHLLHYSDQAATARQDRAFIGASTSSPLPPEVWIKMFTCPDDDTAWQQPYGLSYVANVGYVEPQRWDQELFDTSGQNQHELHTAYTIDWDNDGAVTNYDGRIGYATGIFFREPSWDNPSFTAAQSNGITLQDFRMTVDYIEQGDGQSNTLMYAENKDALNWADITVGIQGAGFGLNVHPDEVDANGPFDLPQYNGVNGTATGDPELKVEPYPQINPNDPVDPHPFVVQVWVSKPNSLKYFGQSAPIQALQEGRAPRPSGNHEDIIHVAMSDGRARTINAGMNQGVYMKLLTPNGQRNGQLVISEAAY
jgi:hypothetical protein